jgi:hypothetical protein
LIAPPPAAAGAGAEGDADDELAGLVDAAADAAALTEVDADVDAAAGVDVDVDPALAEPAGFWVADRFCVGEGVDACELLLHAVAPKATTATVARAARWLGRMIAPNFGPKPPAPVPTANPPAVTSQ